MTLYTVCLTVVLYTSLLSSQTLAGKTTRRFVGLPDSGERITTARGAVTKTLIIRHDLPGRVLFHESNEFWIELQLTTPEGHNKSQVKTTYTPMSNDTILLQVYEPSLALPVEASPQQNLLLIISVSVGSFVFLCLVVSALCYFCYWKKRRVLKNKNGGDPQVEERISEARTMSSKRRFYEAGSGGGPSSGTLTVAMVLAVCACVLQAQVPSASVEITVFFPRGFLRRDSKVFLNSENNNEFGVITNDTSLKINVFDVKNASFIVENQCADKNLTCINGACDPLTGKCACPRKMKIDKRKGGETRCVFRCEDKCSAGFFESSSCNHTHLAVCKKCRPQCSFKEFESVACAGRMDRNCTDISKLPQISVSPNIVYEDLRKAKEDPTLKRTISNFSDTRTVWLNRSTGVAIQVRVLQVDFSSTFKEVEHTSNDNSRLPTVSLASMRNYCNSPIPDYYRLGLQESSETVKIKKGNPSSPCPRYDGKATVLQDNSVLFCNGAENTIVRLFGVKKKMESFSQEEGSRRCYNLKQSCDGCREKCTVEARNNPTCNLTKADSDEGRQNYGEHFTYCFDCCFQVNCTCSSCACSQYESSCLNAQIPCVEVKQFTISIDPIFRKTSVFKCHVELFRGPVFQLEATVWKDGKMLRRVDLTARNNSGEVNERRTRYDYGFMILRQPSVLINGSNKQILIRGNVGQSNFDVGWYNTQDDETVSSTTPTNTLSVEANSPFSINSNDWPNQTCQSLNTGAFAVASTSSAINNFANFTDLEAELGLDDQTRVYKVYNKSNSRQVHFEVPPERSILRYAFPETVVFNDRSFSGKLLKNRTFWTIRLLGRVTECPASFSVRLTDQDQPDVDVFQYDIAITNEDCTFAIEFQLPSGGDTNLIDKQFVVRLTDSRKTMKLILVSPRGMPDFIIPEIDDEFDPKRLEILIPFAGAACGMVLLLIGILVYGYKTRPRDKYHRDRDNDLHFRHILYVVWFVGMRLVKSFLLTFTVFAVILTAIHYTNVTTLQGYEAFHEQQTKVEDDFVKLMDAHKVQEINRQWLILGEGKIVCDRKLKELNAFLEQYFREMRERQEEEMRRKSILRAAEHRIKKQFNATRAKFEAERKRLNKRMEEYAEEVNSRVSQIRGKIEGSFWLKAAKALYKFLDWLASIFGSGIGKPFIRWVGLDVNFPSIDIGLSSFDDIFDGFQNSQLFREGNSSSNESLFKNLLNRDYKLNFSDISAPELNFSSPLSKEKAEELLALEWIAQLYRSGVISTILVLLDILWFVYRHSRTYQLAIVLIHGYPKIYQLEKIQKAEEKEGKKKKKKEEKLRKKKAEKEREQGETQEINDSGEELTDEERDEISDEKIQKNAEEKEGKKKKKKEDKLRQKRAAKKGEQGETPEINNSGEELTDEERDEISDEVDSSLNAKNKQTKMKKDKRSKEEDSVEKDASSNKSEGENDKGKGGHETDVENNSIENKEAKKEKVIRHGLKGLDRLNTAFLTFFVKLKQLNYQINNTNLVPMCVLSVIGILSVYVVIVTAKHSMNVDTLDVVGFYDLKMAPLLTMRKIVNTRITSNAFMVNDVHIPYYENRVNARIAFYRKKAKMYQAYQCAKADLHNEEYCSWASEPGESCDGVGRYNEDFLSNLTQFECNLDPVIPQRFTKFDRIRYKEVYKKATSPYVSALRGLILDTFYMILIVIAIFIILKILGIAVFVLMKKFDLVRQVKHYQTSQDLVKEAAVVPDCIKYPPRESIKHIGPVAVSQEIREKCGPLAREGYHTEWVK